MNALQPPPSILCKLASIAVHADEMMSPDGHAFDRHALESMLADYEIKEWLTEMDKMALAPRKRSEANAPVEPTRGPKKDAE